MGGRALPAGCDHAGIDVRSIAQLGGRAADGRRGRIWSLWEQIWTPTFWRSVVPCSGPPAVMISSDELIGRMRPLPVCCRVQRRTSWVAKRSSLAIQHLAADCNEGLKTDGLCCWHEQRDNVVFWGDRAKARHTKRGIAMFRAVVELIVICIASFCKGFSKYIK